MWAGRAFQWMTDLGKNVSPYKRRKLVTDSSAFSEAEIRNLSQSSNLL